MSETPILDLEQDPPGGFKPARWRVRFLPLIGGGAIGITLAEIGWSPPNFLPGFNFLVWLPALYVAIAIHELGHLAVGKVTGMAPGGLVVGGFRMMRSGDGWKVRFDWRRIIGGGGLAIPLPAKGEFRVARFAWMVAAGPIASILSIAACWAAYTKYGSGDWDWIGSCFWAAAVGLTSLIPMSAGINKSDAAQLWMLWTKPEESRAWMADVAVQAESIRGVRPREWDAALVEQMLSAARTGSGRVFPELMAYFRSLDEGNDSTALEHLEHALAASAKSGSAVRRALYLEAAGASALRRHNAGNARVWRDRALSRKVARKSRASVDGAIAMSEGRFDDALRHIADARAYFAKRGVYAGLMLLVKDELDRRERECRDGLISDRAKASASA